MSGDEIRRIPSRAPAARGWRCPDDQVLAAYADGRLDASGRAQLEKHFAGCEFCLGQVAALAKLADEPLPGVAPGLIARARRIEQPRRMPKWQWAAAAGAIACAALVMTPILRRPAVAPQSDEPRVVRHAPATVARPEIQFPANGATVAPQNLEFRWTGMDAALFYEIRVLTADGDEVWKGRTEGTALRAPTDAGLAGGQKYYLWVSAVLPDGKSAKSAATAFTVAR